VTSTALLPTIEKSLIGQTALVAGPNSGIGPAVAVALGRVSANVVVNYVVGDEETADVVREIETYEVKAYA
jgi:glucose 1-dehydrogenase